MDSLPGKIDTVLGAIPGTLFAWAVTGTIVNVLAGAFGFGSDTLLLWGAVMPFFLMYCFACVVVMAGLFLLLLSWR